MTLTIITKMAELKIIFVQTIEVLYSGLISLVTSFLEGNDISGTTP
jgi:hypothetical protein